MKRNLAQPMAKPKTQLEMVRSGGVRPVVPSLPQGYRLRQYREPDRASYWRLFAEVFATHSRLDDLLTASLPGGFHVVEHEESGDVVASAVAAEYGREGHPERGSLQWVMANPRHAGRGIGRIAVAAATATLVEGGYQRVYLSTDDFRLPAIHVYLELGWKPYLYADDMEARWRAVFEQLNRTPGPDDFVPRS